MFRSGLSFSTRMGRSMRFWKASQLPRSVMVYARRSLAMPSVWPMPWPDSMYHVPCGSMPACFQSPSSRRWVPDLSPRDTKRDCVSAIRLRASTALGMPLILAGSSSAPTMMKSLYMTRRRFCILPSSTYFRSSEGACTSATSASPRAARTRACPVPTETVLTERPVFFSNMGTRRSSSPESWVLVVVDRMTLLDCARAGAASHTEHSSTSSRRSSMRPPSVIATMLTGAYLGAPTESRRRMEADDISRERTARNAGPRGVSRVPPWGPRPGRRSRSFRPAARSSSRKYPHAARYDMPMRSTACLKEPSRSIASSSSARPSPNLTSPKTTQSLSRGRPLTGRPTPLPRQDTAHGSGVIAGAVHHDVPVDDDVGNANGMAMRIGEGGLVAHGGRVEHGEIRGVARLEEAAIRHAELARRHARHLVHRRLPGEELALAAIDAEHAGKRPVAPRVRLAGVRSRARVQRERVGTDHGVRISAGHGHVLLALGEADHAHARLFREHEVHHGLRRLPPGQTGQLRESLPRELLPRARSDHDLIPAIGA